MSAPRSGRGDRNRIGKLQGMGHFDGHFGPADMLGIEDDAQQIRCKLFDELETTLFHVV